MALNDIVSAAVKYLQTERRLRGTADGKKYTNCSILWDVTACSWVVPYPEDGRSTSSRDTANVYQYARRKQ